MTDRGAEVTGTESNDERPARVPPDAEKLLEAIGHIEAAYDLCKSVDAQVNSHLHMAKVEAERKAGMLIFQHERRLRNLEAQRG